jgi:hypothetical protein
MLNDKTKRVLAKLDAQTSFICFARGILINHETLKEHYILKFSDEYGDHYEFEFLEDLSESLTVKFQLLGHIFDVDRENQIETLLKDLGWYYVSEHGFGLDDLIYEASFYDRQTGVKDFGGFCRLDPQEWKTFINYLA